MDYYIKMNYFLDKNDCIVSNTLRIYVSMNRYVYKSPYMEI